MKELAVKTQQMKRNFIALLFIFISTIIFGQNKLEINYESIKTTIENSESEYYYPKLLKRFNEFDSKLTNEEYALIYYGFSFQKDYLKNKPDDKNLSKLSKANDYEAIVKECENILKKNPVSLKANNEMGYALYKLGKPEAEWEKYQNRYRAIRKVIVYSGDGLSEETAFKVIYVEDEYNMLYNYFEISKIYKQELIGLCDRFIIEPSEYYKSSNIYFNISRKLLRNNEMLRKK